MIDKRMRVMPDLPGDIRELVLFQLEDVRRRLDAIEDMLCLSEEEENDDSELP